MLREGSKGAHISLTDHFSIPSDVQAEENAIFHLPIGPGGLIGDGVVKPGEWHTLDLSWNYATRECLVFLDGNKSPLTRLPQLRARSEGVSYVRLRVEDVDRVALKEALDPGFIVELVDVKIGG
jgi:hypothetical protein